MWNLGRARAIGGSFFVDAGHETLVGGLTARYRQWLSSEVGLDVGLGYASPFVVVKGKLSVGDIIGPVIRAETGSGATYWSAGLELGSGAGAVAIVLTTLVGVIAMAACC